MKKTFFAAAASLAASAAFAATSTPAGWTDDFDAAKARAAAENKFILADFSGSDWCGWCKKLDREVFARPEFLESATNKFVLLMVDSPSDKSLLSEKAAKQNPGLVEKYGVGGFPTVLLLDANGDVVAKTGYRAGGPVKYLEHIDSKVKSARGLEAFKREVSALGKGTPERLAKIDAFFSGADEETLNANAGYVEELLSADSAKYGPKYPEFAYVRPVSAKLEKVLRELNREFAKRCGDKKPSKEKIEKIREELDPLAREKFTAILADVKVYEAKAKAAGVDVDKIAELFQIKEHLEEVVKGIGK